MIYPKFYIGTMSKNIVDVIIEEEHYKKIGLLSSRRQIDYFGGYSNKWSTRLLYEYIKKKNKKAILFRDHGGQDQGIKQDDGIVSFEEDVRFFDFIHIDPFLACMNLEKAAEQTLSIIIRLYNLNQKILFEVGTEEAIFKYEPDDLNFFLSYLKLKLQKKIFNNIKYAVIQTGTHLNLPNMSNDGDFDIEKTLKFLEVTKNFGILSKEHNGDYQIDNKKFKIKFSTGIDAINIAPEFGQLESIEYIKLCSKDKSLFETLYNLCLQSNKWKKWIKNSKKNFSKEEIILTCCHYILSDNIFIKLIKSKFPDIDQKVKIKIKEKLNKLYE